MLGPPLLRCPRCRSPHVSPIPRSRAGDYVAALFRRRPYACRWCRRRFRARAYGVFLRPPDGGARGAGERAEGGLEV